MKFSVVIPNWNGQKLLERNLPAVLLLRAEEIIVADDGSTDGSVEFIEKQFPMVRVVSHKHLGFAGNCNKGVGAAVGEIVILLNTDVVPDKNLLASLKKHFSDPSIFAVSFNEKNNEKYAWTKGIFKDGFIAHEVGEKDDKIHDTFWASGGSAAFRRSYWIELGGMDEIFNPFYWEDIDLSYRAQKRGWRVLWDPKAAVVHEHKGVIGKNFSSKYIGLIQERNRLIFVWKNLSDKNLFKQHLIGLLKRLVSHPLYLRAVLTALAKLFLILPARAKEKREGTVKDEEIISQG